MKKVFCILFVVVMMMTAVIAASMAETANDYASMEDFMARYDLQYAAASRDEFMRLFREEGPKAAGRYLFDAMGLTEGVHETMAIDLSEGDFTKVLVIVYPADEVLLRNMDKTILDAFVFELV